MTEVEINDREGPRWLVVGGDRGSNLVRLLQNTGTVAHECNAVFPSNSLSITDDVFDDWALESSSRWDQFQSLVVLLAADQEPPDADLGDDSFSAEVLSPLRRAFLLTRFAVDEFLSNGINGRIVLAYVGSQASEMMGVTKSALDGFVACVGKEYGARGIRINSVVGSDDQDLARMIEFLTSSESEFVTGETHVLGTH
ncbi:MAG: SDR family oxidoreductase [Planctomycetota bacterium]